MMEFFSAKRFDVKLLAAVLFLFGILAVSGAPGDIDTSFNASVAGTNSAAVNVIKNQPDGKFLVGGAFNNFNGVTACGIVRLNTDGSLDPSFNSPDFGNCTPGSGTIHGIAVQSDGKIIVGGEGLSLVNGIFTGQKVHRLNPDGSLDTTFQAPTFSDSAGVVTVFDVEVQADNKILIGGGFEIPQEIGGVRLTRLNANGTVDPTFANFSTVGVVYDKEIQ